MSSYLPRSNHPEREDRDRDPRKRGSNWDRIREHSRSHWAVPKSPDYRVRSERPKVVTRLSFSSASDNQSKLNFDPS